MKFSVTVMSHPKREAITKELINKINFMQKPESFTTLGYTIDEENNVWNNLKNALLYRGKDVTHHVILEDDCIPSCDFLNIIDKSIKLKPDNPIAYFFRGKIMLKAVKDETSWLKSNQLKHLVAWAIPIKYINELINFNDYCFNEKENTDNRVTAWATWKGIDCFTTVPSFVEHKGKKSLFGIRNPRKATVFVDTKAEDVLNNDKHLEYNFDINKIKTLKKEFKYLYG